MGWQCQSSCIIKRVLQLGLKVGQVGGGQIFQAHADHP
jgi:hypothetical protein